MSRHADRRGHASSAARATSPACWPAFDEAVELLESLGAEVVEVSCPHFDYALPAYYLIAPSECSSNLARFDAHALRPAGRRRRHPRRRGGHVADPRAGLRRRGQAPHHPRHLRAVHRLLRRLLRPGAEGPHADHPGLRRGVRARSTCWSRRPRRPRRSRIGERADDPMAMYLADLCTIPSDLAGNAGDLGAVRAGRRGRPAGRPAGHGARRWPTTGCYRVGRRGRGRVRRDAGATRCSPRRRGCRP